MTPHITTKIYGLVRRGHEILAERIHEADGTLKRYRPLGGTLEFQERSEDGIRREFMEELGTEIEIVRLYTVAKEIFTYRGKSGHQVAFIYEITLRDKTLYEQNEIERVDGMHGITIKAEWIDPMNVPHGVPLVPDDFALKLKHGQYD